MDRTAARGLSAVRAMFEAAKRAERAAFMPYFPIGYPTIAESIEIIAALARLGVDGFEIGMPFSDPLADGPVIQAAAQTALENGTTVRVCLDAVRELRERGVQQPMMMMGYLNPLIAYGVERFILDAKAAGADGLIVPDLPPEEGAEFATICAREGLAMVFFLAPTSSAERIALVAKAATGFIYVVSLTGVTGARAELPPDLTAFLDRVKRAVGDVPLVLGFGISTPEQAKLVSAQVDGFIVGSALVKAGSESAAAVCDLAARIIEAIR
jgi:tryptophan synthase alpha chain